MRGTFPPGGKGYSAPVSRDLVTGVKNADGTCDFTSVLKSDSLVRLAVEYNKRTCEAVIVAGNWFQKIRSEMRLDPPVAATPKKPIAQGLEDLGACDSMPWTAESRYSSSGQVLFRYNAGLASWEPKVFWAQYAATRIRDKYRMVLETSCIMAYDNWQGNGYISVLSAGYDPAASGYEIQYTSNKSGIIWDPGTIALGSNTKITLHSWLTVRNDCGGSYSEKTWGDKTNSQGRMLDVYSTSRSLYVWELQGSASYANPATAVTPFIWCSGDHQWSATVVTGVWV